MKDELRPSKIIEKYFYEHIVSQDDIIENGINKAFCYFNATRDENNRFIHSSKINNNISLKLANGIAYYVNDILLCKSTNKVKKSKL